MNDPMQYEVLLITLSFITMMVVLVLAVLMLEKAGWP
ncbi:small membrane protein YoaI [Yokenella regensburgei]